SLHEFARLFFVVHIHDDANDERALVEEILEPGAHRREFIRGDRFQNLKDQGVVCALGKRLLLIELFHIPIKRSRMPPRIPRRLCVRFSPPHWPATQKRSPRVLYSAHCAFVQDPASPWHPRDRNRGGWLSPPRRRRRSTNRLLWRLCR